MARKGRPPKGPKLVDKLGGSAHAKTRLKIVLETLAGLSVSDACAKLGVKEAAFHRLRDRALQAALDGLEPRPPGRRPKETPEERSRATEFEAELKELKIDLQAARVREEIALAMPYLLTYRRGKKGGDKRRGAARARRKLSAEKEERPAPREATHRDTDGGLGRAEPEAGIADETRDVEAGAPPRDREDREETGRRLHEVDGKAGALDKRVGRTHRDIEPDAQQVAQGPPEDAPSAAAKGQAGRRA